MDNFRVIYRILKALEKAMDFDEFDMDSISPKALGISENRWLKIMVMLTKEGYIEGLSIRRGLGDEYLISGTHPEITLRGLEYLNENSLMRKAAAFAKGVAEAL